MSQFYCLILHAVEIKLILRVFSTLYRCSCSACVADSLQDLQQFIIDIKYCFFKLLQNFKLFMKNLNETIHFYADQTALIQTWTKFLSNYTLDHFSPVTYLWVSQVLSFVSSNNPSCPLPAYFKSLLTVRNILAETWKIRS